MKRHGGFGDKVLQMSRIFTGRGERKGSETFEVTRTKNLAHDKKKTIHSLKKSNLPMPNFTFPVKRDGS